MQQRGQVWPLFVIGIGVALTAAWMTLLGWIAVMAVQSALFALIEFM